MFCLLPSRPGIITLYSVDLVPNPMDAWLSSMGAMVTCSGFQVDTLLLYRLLARCSVDGYKQAPYRRRPDSIGFAVREAVAILTRSRAGDESAAAVQHASMSPGAHDRFKLPYPTSSPVPVPTPAPASRDTTTNY
ncbi:hypothetical protein VTN96DRAFT_259 [Rasamsonia emersonii]